MFLISIVMCKCYLCKVTKFFETLRTSTKDKNQALGFLIFLHYSSPIKFESRGLKRIKHTAFSIYYFEY